MRLLLLFVVLMVACPWPVIAGSTLFRGTGTMSSAGFLPVKTEQFVATVVMGISNDDRLQIGYQAKFSDGSKEQLALVLTQTNPELPSGEAELRTHSGSRHRGDGFLGVVGSWSETDDGYLVKFVKEDRSKLEIAIDIENSPTKIGGDLIPDVKVTITISDSAPDDRGELTVNWKILSRLDFNALMRDDDNSADSLLEELFAN